MVASLYGASEAGEGLGRIKSRVVFTFCFMEMMTWFWVCFPRPIVDVVLGFPLFMRIEEILTFFLL